jgi:hypothetical protein
MMRHAAMRSRRPARSGDNHDRARTVGMTPVDVAILAWGRKPALVALARLKVSRRADLPTEAMRHGPTVAPLHDCPDGNHHHRRRKTRLRDRDVHRRARPGRRIARWPPGTEPSNDQDDPQDPKSTAFPNQRSDAPGFRCLIGSTKVHGYASLVPDRARVKQLDTYPPRRWPRTPRPPALRAVNSGSGRTGRSPQLSAAAGRSHPYPGLPAAASSLSG